MCMAVCVCPKACLPRSGSHYRARVCEGCSAWATEGAKRFALENGFFRILINHILCFSVRGIKSMVKGGLQTIITFGIVA